MRLEPWECFISFICSANSNMPRIHQVMERMATAYGNPIEMDGQIRHSFPGPLQLAQAGELELRRLGLGFRAPYVAKAAQRVSEGWLNLDALVDVPYPEAKERLMECAGIGPKIADCIAVFSLDKLEGFPVDRWVRRCLKEWYFQGSTISDAALLSWAQGRWGRYAGYVQQYLFHDRRLTGRAAPRT